MKEILVLGGGGFIGRNIVASLLDRDDCNVVAADIREGSNWNQFELDNVKKIALGELLMTLLISKLLTI